VISEIVIMVAGKRYSAQSWFSIGTKVFFVCLLFWGGQKSNNFLALIIEQIKRSLCIALYQHLCSSLSLFNSPIFFGLIVNGLKAFCNHF